MTYPFIFIYNAQAQVMENYCEDNLGLQNYRLMLCVTIKINQISKLHRVS
jgi:hypothetical protein